MKFTIVGDPPVNEVTRSTPGVARHMLTVAHGLVGTLCACFQVARRQSDELLAELTQVKGLIVLVMRERNREAWSSEDRRELGEHARRLTRIALYLLALIVPGGLLMLPALFWCLDRRRHSLLSGARGVIVSPRAEVLALAGTTR